MATFDVNLSENEGYALPYAGNRVSVARRTVDFTETANQLAQNKIMSIFKVPADVIVLQFGMKVTTADTDVTDVDLGLYTEDEDGAITAVDIDGYGDGLSLAGTGYVGMDLDAAFNVGGATPLKPVAAESHLTIKNIDSDTINQAVVEFFAVLLDIS